MRLIDADKIIDSLGGSEIQINSMFSHWGEEDDR